jgi:hypothetical protein
MPIEATDVPIVSEPVKPKQFLNAVLPMEVTEFGMVIGPVKPSSA